MTWKPNSIESINSQFQPIKKLNYNKKINQQVWYKQCYLPSTRHWLASVPPQYVSINDAIVKPVASVTFSKNSVCFGRIRRGGPRGRRRHEPAEGPRVEAGRATVPAALGGPALRFAFYQEEAFVDLWVSNGVDWMNSRSRICDGSVVLKHYLQKDVLVFTVL